MNLNLLATTALALPASAVNNSDTPFSGYAGYTVGSGSVVTSTRAKQDDSSTYMYNQSSYKLYVKTMGYMPYKGSYRWENKTANAYALVPAGQYFVRQYVYEDGGRSEKLDITTATNYGTTKYVHGLWSPDSIGSYSYAN